MTFNEQRLLHLLISFSDNKATEQEIEEMLDLLRQPEGDRELEFFIMELKQRPRSHTLELPVEWENIWDKIHRSAIKSKAPVRKMKWLRAAAAILISIGISAYFLNHSTKKQIVKSEPLPAVRELKSDVQ